MRAIVEAVNLRPMGFEVLLEPGMKRVDIGARVMTQRDTALIADHNYAAPGAVQCCNGRLGAGQKMKIAATADVAPSGALRLMTPSRSKKT